MSEHVAVVREPYLGLIAMGLKTVESRLSVSRCAPFGRVSAGDVVWFKRPGGGCEVRARCGRVRSWEGLTPGGVAEIRREFGERVAAPASYWREKRGSRFATLVWLEGVELRSDGPTVGPLHGRAWVCLEEAARG